MFLPVEPTHGVITPRSELLVKLLPIYGLHVNVRLPLQIDLAVDTVMPPLPTESLLNMLYPLMLVPGATAAPQLPLGNGVRKLPPPDP